MCRSMKLIATGLFALMIAACGGGGTSDEVTANKAGAVALTFTDAPSDDFHQINIEVSAIKLLGENDPVALFDAEADGGSRILDLLSLQAYSEYFTVDQNVPAGIYHKIRLTVASIELVKIDSSGVAIESIYPDLPANGKIDLNPRESFVVEPGKTLQIQIDIDADKSFEIHQAGNSDNYKFRPVVFINIINSDYRGRLVRLFGSVDSIDRVNSSLVLCPDSGSSHSRDDSDDDEDEHCLRIHHGNATAFSLAGTPVDAYEYSVGEPLTAIGFLAHSDDGINRAKDDSDDDTENDSDEETSPDDDDSDVGDNDANDDNSYDATDDDSSDLDDDTTDDAESDDFEHRSLNAEVIELGPRDGFENIKGMVLSQAASENDRFVITMRGDASTDIGVQLQAGTKIFNKQGIALDYTEITQDLFVMVDGVFTDTEEPVLNAALIIADTDELSAERQEEISGYVLSVDVDNSVITIGTDTGDLQILVDRENTAVFLIHEDVDFSELSEGIDLSEIMAGQEIEVYGTMHEDGYFHATVVLVENEDHE